MKNLENVEKLLEETSRLVQSHEKRMREHGYMFNLFSILKVERKEVNTHSAMIADLLNPNGRHGQGDVFLKVFLRTIDKELVNHSQPPERIAVDDIDFSKITVLKEEPFHEGKDRIDIRVKFNNDTHLIIENKIDAQDGDKQLKRYDDIGKKELVGRYCLLYLTKYGSDANENSHKGVSYGKISYKKHIITWLEECIKEVALVPMVREAIFQYLNLVKKITGVGMNNELNQEIIKLLCTGKNIQAGLQIERQIKAAKGKLLFDFFATLEKEIGYASISNFSGQGRDRVYNLQKCQRIFEGKRKRIPYIGVFFDIGLPNHLFHIEIAEAYLYWGLIKVSKTNNKYQIVSYDKGQSFEKNLEPKEWSVRSWPLIQWYAIKGKALSSKEGLEMLLNPKQFIDDVVKNHINEVVPSV